MEKPILPYFCFPFFSVSPGIYSHILHTWLRGKFQERALNLSWCLTIFLPWYLSNLFSISKETTQQQCVPACCAHVHRSRLSSFAALCSCSSRLPDDGSLHWVFIPAPSTLLSRGKNLIIYHRPPMSFLLHSRIHRSGPSPCSGSLMIFRPRKHVLWFQHLFLSVWNFLFCRL